MTAAIAAVELEILTIFLIAAGVGIVVAKIGRFPYTIALLLAGIGVSVLGVGFDIQLSHDIIFLVLLPPLLFEGAATMDLNSLRRNLHPVAAMAVIGLIGSVLLLGWLGSMLLGLPLLISLLFAAMILPTDPVSVLALFKEVGAPERLSTLVEAESLFNDGIGVVLFTVILGLVRESQQAGFELAAAFTPGRLAGILGEIAVTSIGGLLVGGIAGYAVYKAMKDLDEHMTEIVLTILLAYGSFLIAEHYLHVSGVIATVSAALLLGNRGAEEAMSPQTKIAVFDTWETAAFLVNTFIFLMIGAKTPVGQLIQHANLIAGAFLLTLFARAAAVYPITTVVNRFISNPIPRDYMHVMVWSGLHASIPIALVLGLSDVPHLAELQAMVFGVAALSLTVQGLSMAGFLDRLGVNRREDEEKLYELLLGKARAVDSALDALQDLYKKGSIPYIVFKECKQEYEKQKDDLSTAISRLLEQNPGIREEEIHSGERVVLNQEKSAIMDAVRRGTINESIGEQLIEELDIQLDNLEEGESVVRGTQAKEQWRKRAEEEGLLEGEDDQD
ncbi:MAG: cation:proton antiporter [Candidatus Nanohaloarchaea archaeon]|nr:cation:proton antiporter [Candidatus Nanohaloarchaea archaeon]